MPKINKQEVIQIAKLAAIEISEDQLDQATQDLDSILNYIDVLNEADVENIEPTSHVHGINNAFREDITKESLSPEEILKLAPSSSGQSFKVPKIIN